MNGKIDVRYQFKALLREDGRELSFSSGGSVSNLFVGPVARNAMEVYKRPWTREIDVDLPSDVRPPAGIPYQLIVDNWYQYTFTIDYSSLLPTIVVPYEFVVDEWQPERVTLKIDDEGNEHYIYIFGAVIRKPHDVATSWTKSRRHLRQGRVHLALDELNVLTKLQLRDLAQERAINQIDSIRKREYEATALWPKIRRTVESVTDPIVSLIR
ncbi:MAG: hypothetical protein ACXVAG_18400 [Vulcanimicrobiaceae bacterium]